MILIDFRGFVLGTVDNIQRGGGRRGRGERGGQGRGALQMLQKPFTGPI